MSDRVVKFKTLVWKFKETSFKYPEFSEMPKKAINSPEDVFKLFNPLLREESKEVFLVVWLSATNRAQGFEIVSSGCLSSSLVDPRIVFRGAITAVRVLALRPEENRHGQFRQIITRQEIKNLLVRTSQ